MKRIKSTVTYTVPSWNYCNSDNLVRGEVTKDKCRFCARVRGGHHCLLYDEALYGDGETICKTAKCKRATVGLGAEIVTDNVAPQQPTINPKDIIKQTIELYTKTVNDLTKDGYPRQLAENLAKQHLLGGK